MNRTWINYGDVSAISAFSEKVFESNQPMSIRYWIKVHLKNGKELDFNFANEADQIKAYEEHKPK